MAYDDMYAAAPALHTLSLDGREKLSVTGVNDVGRFDESEIDMRTSKGELCIHGEGLHIEKLSLDSGEVLIGGKIDSMEYGSEETDGGGFFSRLFG